MILYLRLFWEFFKTGLFSVGGGMATIPFLQDVSDKTGWFTHSQLTDMVAVAESTPGAIGVNTATYVGYTVGGIPGGIIATLGLVAPSIIIIACIAAAINAFKDNRFVVSVFRYLRPASLGLILSAGSSIIMIALFTGPVGSDTLNIRACILVIVLAVFMIVIPQTKNLHPIVWIGASAVLGILFL